MAGIPVWDTLIIHCNLNPVEAEILLKWMEDKGHNPSSLSLDELKSLYVQFLDDDPDEKIIDPDDLQGGEG